MSIDFWLMFHKMSTYRDLDLFILVEAPLQFVIVFAIFIYIGLGIVFSIDFHRSVDDLSIKKRRKSAQQTIEKTSNFELFFSPMLVDLGFQNGAWAFHHSLVWATMAALGGRMALCWAIFRVPIRFLARLGSIFGWFSTKSGFIFWFSLPFSNNYGGRSLLVRCCFLLLFLFVCFVLCYNV